MHRRTYTHGWTTWKHNVSSNQHWHRHKNQGQADIQLYNAHKAEWKWRINQSNGWWITVSCRQFRWWEWTLQWCRPAPQQPQSVRLSQTQTVTSHYTQQHQSTPINHYSTKAVKQCCPKTIFYKELRWT